MATTDNDFVLLNKTTADTSKLDIFSLEKVLSVRQVFQFRFFNLYQIFQSLQPIHCSGKRHVPLKIVLILIRFLHYVDTRKVVSLSERQRWMNYATSFK